MAKKQQFVPLSAILRIGGLLLLATPALCELKTLLFVRRYGRYDPSQIWTGPQNILVGVNDCLEDESDLITDHMWKGDYRSPILDNLTDYRISDVEMVLYNKQGDELLTLQNCTIPEPGKFKTFCLLAGTNVSISQLDAQGGLAVRIVDSNKIAVAIFNPRHYFSDTSLFNGLKIAVNIGIMAQNLPTRPTGYKGCATVSSSEQPTTVPMNVDQCFAICSGLFAIQTNKCYCNLGSPSFIDESNCQFLCDRDSNQFCGHENKSSYAVYNKDELQAFKTYVSTLPYDDVKSVSEFTMAENNISHLVSFPSTTYISSVQITEEEECTLTSIYFNMTGPDQVPRYRLTYTVECGKPESEWDSFNDTMWGINKFLKAGEEALELGLLRVRCLRFEAIESNLTYPRANVTFFGPTGKTAEVNGFALRANYELIVESSSEILPSSTVSEMSASSIDSVSMEMTSSVEASISPDVTATTETAIAAVETSYAPTETAIAAVDTSNAPTETATATVETSYAPTETAIAAVDTSNAPTEMATATVETSYAPTETAIAAVDTSNAPTETATATVETSYAQTETAIAAVDTSNAPTDSRSTAMPTDATVTITATMSSSTMAPVPPVTTPTPTRSETCMCRCKTEDPAQNNKTEEEVKEQKVAKIKKELNVDTKQLSATKMKKESASDVRTSAQVTGYLGIIMLTLIIGMLLLSDITSIFQHVSMLKSNIQQTLKQD
ncbi:uncharacterized protein LOC121390422 [Gigantopelta aegis]|uniref:uncharacterized protein LOC121390422 n=1 Tax=Gigantopelta aegis TaxID=1735272 RepID=UPI001B88B445|nr:uncharacterized protein LOC121390422 [Gigantopelta aegis]